MTEQTDIKNINNCPVISKCTECGLKFNFTNILKDKNIYCHCYIPLFLSKDLEDFYSQNNFPSIVICQKRKNKFNENVEISKHKIIKVSQSYDKKLIDIKDDCFHDTEINRISMEEWRFSNINRLKYRIDEFLCNILYTQENYDLSEDDLKKMFISL